MVTRWRSVRKAAIALAGVVAMVGASMLGTGATASASLDTGASAVGDMGAASPGVGASNTEWQAWAAQQRAAWSAWASTFPEDLASVTFGGQYSQCALKAFDKVTEVTGDTGTGVPAGLELPSASAVVHCPDGVNPAEALKHRTDKPRLATQQSANDVSGSVNGTQTQMPLAGTCGGITGGNACLGVYSGATFYASYQYLGSTSTRGWVEFSYNGSEPNGCSVGAYVAGSTTETLYHGDGLMVIKNPGQSSWWASTWWTSPASQDWGSYCTAM